MSLLQLTMLENAVVKQIGLFALMVLSLLVEIVQQIRKMEQEF